MSLIRGKDTGLEKTVFAHLRKKGIRFHKHYKLLPGKPDVSVPAIRKAVFIDGDFWHGWRFSEWENRLSSEFWKQKIRNNIRRDKRNFAKIRRRGWKVLRVWGHRFSTKAKTQKVLERIEHFLTAD